jgi:hypothetical protein
MQNLDNLSVGAEATVDGVDINNMRRYPILIVSIEKDQGSRKGKRPWYASRRNNARRRKFSVAPEYSPVFDIANAQFV